MEKKKQFTERQPQPRRAPRLYNHKNIERDALRKRDDEYIRTGRWEPIRTYEYDEY